MQIDFTLHHNSVVKIQLRVNRISHKSPGQKHQMDIFGKHLNQFLYGVCKKLQSISRKQYENHRHWVLIYWFSRVKRPVKTLCVISKWPHIIIQGKRHIHSYVNVQPCRMKTKQPNKLKEALFSQNRYIQRTSTKILQGTKTNTKNITETKGKNISNNLDETEMTYVEIKPCASK